MYIPTSSILALPLQIGVGRVKIPPAQGKKTVNQSAPGSVIHRPIHLGQPQKSKSDHKILLNILVGATIAVALGVSIIEMFDGSIALSSMSS